MLRGRPCIKDLRAIAEAFNKSYTGVAPKRLMWIALYDQLVRWTAKDNSVKTFNVLNGVLVFFLGNVKLIEYKGGSPSKGANGMLSWMTGSGSDFYSIVKEKLLITKPNKFGYDDRLFFLNEFYKCIEQEYPDDGISQLADHEKVKAAFKTNPIVLDWKCKQDLLADIQKVKIEILKRNSNQLDYLIHGFPVLNVLLESLNNLKDDYSKESSNPNNPQRLAAIYFIKFIAQCQQLGNPSDDSWRAISGAILIILMDIAEEYRKWWMDPNRSTLYRKLLAVINQESLDKITVSDKIKWLTALNEQIIFISKRDEYNNVLKKIFEDSPNQKNEIENLDLHIKNFKQKIESHLKVLDINKTASSTTKSFIETGASYAVQAISMPVIFQASKAILTGTLYMAGFLVSGPVGSAVFGEGGALLISSLGRLMGEGVLNSASAGLCAWLLQKIGNKVGSKIADLVSMSFEATPKGIEEMRMELKPIDDIVFVNMVNTMLEMPPMKDDKGKEYLTDKDKESIRKLLGLKEGETLKPLKTSLINDLEEKKIQEMIMIQGQAVKDFRPKEDESESEVELLDEEKDLQSNLRCSI